MRKVLRIPAGAVWLGVGGLIPFVALSGSAPFLSGAHKTWAVFAIGGYGAVILSFLGGIQWGLVMGAGSRNGRDDTSAGRLVLTVVPSLIGWAALLMPAPANLALLAGGFACVLYVDVAAARAGNAPAWYPHLRWPLSCVVVTSLVFGCFA
jgi:hypothetical protein